eukprot:jgi/Ulvmu1/1358/UM011_0086.1
MDPHKRNSGSVNLRFARQSPTPTNRMDIARRSSIEPARNGSVPTPSSAAHGRPRLTWFTMVRRSWKDWVTVLVLLALLAVSEEAGGGRRMHITDSVLEQVQYPFVKSTVPSWSVPLYNLVGPPVVIAIHSQVRGRASLLTHHGVMGSLFSTSASALITNVLKLTVGRPRPSFFYRCWPDGEAVFEPAEGPDKEPKCSPKDKHDVVDGYKSFPSGHTSWSFGAMGFLSLYIFHFWKLGGIDNAVDMILVLLPVSFAAWVGATRVIDYYHNASDVVAGGLIGAAVAVFVFYVVFPWGKLPHVKPVRAAAQEDEPADSSDGNVEMLPV